MRSIRFLLGMILLFATLPAHAAPACYTPAQLQAEQLLRLHSELMVITVTCRQGSQGQDLPAAYGDFTHKNIRELHDAEQTMVGYYKNTAKGNPVDHLDRLRTILANEVGQKSADMTPDGFCAAYRDRVVQLDRYTTADVENEVQRMEISERSYGTPCGAAKVVKAAHVSH